jgi:hypothetical protein
MITRSRKMFLGSRERPACVAYNLTAIYVKSSAPHKACYRDGFTLTVLYGVVYQEIQLFISRNIGYSV